MGLQEIRDLADKLTARLAEEHDESPDEVAFRQAGRLAHLLDELDLESEAPQGPGFVVLPIEAHDRLRAAAERAETAEARARELEKLTGRESRRANRAEAQLAERREWSEVGPEERKRAAAEWRLQCDLERLRDERPDPARLPINPEPGREGDRIEPFTPGPMHVTPRTIPDPVVHQHLRDLQAEIDSLKDRHEASCRELEEIKRRLTRCEDTHHVTDAAHDNLSDQVKAFAARINKIEAQARPRPIDSAVAPFTSSPA